MPRTFASWVDTLIERLVAVRGELDGGVRRAMLERAAAAAFTTGDTDADAVPASLRAWVDTVARHAYRATDEDVARLRAAGHGEDAIFEATLCAATGASLARLRRGLAVIAAGAPGAVSAAVSAGGGPA